MRTSIFCVFIHILDSDKMPAVLKITNGIKYTENYANIQDNSRKQFLAEIRTMVSK